MTWLLNILSPAPFKPEITDSETVDKDYRYWRVRIFYSMFVGYALYYVTRKSFTFVMPALASDLQFDKGELGLLGTIFAITYGISKFASGVIGDRTNPRYFMALGLFMTGVVNILFGLSSTTLLFALFWGLNGWFQGFGWPPCARYLTHWYSHTERGSWWSSWNISHNVGAFSIPWLAGFLIYYFDWRWGMYIPGVICILGALFLVNRLRDTPQSLGLPPIEKYRDDYPEEVVKNQPEEELSVKEIFSTYILKNRYLWILAVAYFFVYIVRQGVNDWTALYLVEEKGYSSIGANGSVSMFEIGGIFGTLAAGWSSDYFFGAKRGPVNLLYAVGILAALFTFWNLSTSDPLLDSILIFIIGFTVFGPQMMIGMHAAELCPKNAAATATGFVGTFAYLGSAIAGYPLGVVTQIWGWEGFFWFMVVCASLSILLLFPLWSVTKASETKLPASA
ncbi:MAG: MFS transporter [Chlamydiia bacterium]|nr:MFS transporter [Chlamydiia bacterium]